MKRYITVIFFLVAVLSLPVCADELYTPDEVRALLGTDAYEFVSGGGDILAAAVDVISGSLTKIYPVFLSLCGVLIISCLIKYIGGIGNCDSGAYGIASRLCCCIIVFSAVKSSCFAVKTAMDSMAAFMTGMIGVMCTGWGLVGNISLGSKFGASVALGVQCVSFLSSYCVMPMTYSCFGLSLGEVLSDKLQISALISSIKKLTVFLLGTATTLFSFSLGIKTVSAASADTLINRGVKFAAASFIPIVGASLAEATSTVVQSMKMIRTLSSVAAIVVILFTVLSPAAVLCINKLSLSCASGISGMLSLDSEKKLIDGINSLLTVLLAMLICSAVVFVVSCGLFMRTNYA